VTSFVRRLWKHWKERNDEQCQINVKNCLNNWLLMGVSEMGVTEWYLMQLVCLGENDTHKRVYCPSEGLNLTLQKAIPTDGSRYEVLVYRSVEKEDVNTMFWLGAEHD